MDGIWRSITIALIICILGFVKVFARSSKLNKLNNNIIKLPKIYFLGGIFSSIVWLLLLVLLPYIPTPNTEEYLLFAKIMFIIFSLPGLAIAYYYLIWEIKFDNEGFTFRNWRGRTEKYRYAECKTELKSARIDLFHHNKRILKISTVLSSNWYEMTKRIEPLLPNR